MIKFKCTKCEEQLEAPSSMIGERLQCPQCQFPEIIPDEPDATEPLKLDMAETDNLGKLLIQIRNFGEESGINHKTEFKRDLLHGQKNATRIRTFHTRLSDNAMAFLDDQINEWIDQNPEIEVKSSSTVIGEVEGKKSEQHMIITIWY